MSTPFDAAYGQIRSHDQSQSAIKAAQEQFSLIRKKHLVIKVYLVRSLAGGQTGGVRSAKETFKGCPLLVAVDQTKADLVAFIKKPEPKDAIEIEKTRLMEQYQQLAGKLSFDGNHQVEIRFDMLSSELIWQLHSDEMVDRALTPQTRASIRIMLGTLACSDAKNRH